MFRYEERGTDHLTANEINELAYLYERYIADDPEGPVDEAKTQIIWLNRLGLFNQAEVKEFLDEQGNSDRTVNERC